MPIVIIPKIPERLPTTPDHFPNKPTWTWTKPETWVHPEIPVEIEFPLVPTKVPLRLKIEVAGKGTFEVALALTAVEAGAAST